MKIVIFYEKPGCATNAKQKKSLRDADCMVIERNLLEHGMNIEELHTFFKKLPVDQWFNPNAPKIKNGEINPSLMNEMTALNLLIMEPTLIRRPLMVIGNKKLCGFDQAGVENLLKRSFPTEVSTTCSDNHQPCA